jgi:hypothetical protein
MQAIGVEIVANQFSTDAAAAAPRFETGSRAIRSSSSPRQRICPKHNHMTANSKVP